MSPRLQISRPKPIILPWMVQLTPWQRFRRDSTTFLAQWLYNVQPKSHNIGSFQHLDAIRIVCISDTHCSTPKIADGDVLLHAGDLTNTGSFSELQAQLNWINSLPHTYKVVIGGNHDRLLDPAYVDRFPERIHEGPGTSRSDLSWGSIIYLNNTSTRLQFGTNRSLSIYGSPWTPEFGTFAFQYPPIRKVWKDTIPNDIDIILTHGPPKGHLDLQGKGCPQLLKEIRQVRPKLVVFGHIHAARGQQALRYDSIGSGYDKIMLGEGGLMTIIMMAIITACKWFYFLLFRFIGGRYGTDKAPVTRLVNAAMVGGRNNEEQYEAVVVRL